MKNKKILLFFFKFMLLFFYLPSIIVGIVYFFLLKNSKLEFLFLFILIATWIIGFIFFIIISKKQLLLKIESNNKNIDNSLFLKLKNLEIELDDLKEFIKKTSDIFFSIAHEIKNPLSIISGYASAILQFDSHFNEEKKKEFIKRIGSEAQRLNCLIRDYLNNLKEIDNLDEMKFQKVDIINIIEYFYNIYEMKAKEDKINFILNIENPIPYIWGNNEKLQFVISNLLSNALKYVLDRGFIEIEAKRENDFVLISVTNSYDKSQKIKKELIFNKFSKIDKPEIKTEGLGLGLYIAKTIIDKHQGKIGVKTNEEKGILTFYFTLPLYKKGMEKIR